MTVKRTPKKMLRNRRIALPQDMFRSAISRYFLGKSQDVAGQLSDRGVVNLSAIRDLLLEQRV
jgi:hypothetical protein